MPDNGPAAEFTASPQASQPINDFIGLFPSAPTPGATPGQIVQGFLVASANYPTYAALADDYLDAAAAKSYNPSGLTVLSGFTQFPEQTAGHHDLSHATVQTTGTVETSYGSSPQGQYFWPQGQDGATSTYTFDLVKVNGQWRISNPPHSRMLGAEDFQYYFQSRDLYFFDAATEQTLVPDSVFVPLSTDEQVLVAGLVSALSQQPNPAWLGNATQTAFPPAKVLGVTVDGATATVNLGGAIAHASARILQQVSAQLVWTLTSVDPVPGSIQSVVLELNGQPWTSTGPPPCADGPSPTSFQTLAAYECFNPFPSTAASFYYVNGGQAWSRCGTKAQALEGSIGTIVPLVGHTGAFSTPDCGSSRYLPEPGATGTPAQPTSIGSLAMASVSPDGKYLAVVPPGHDEVYVVSLPGAATSLPATPRWSTTDITALSWDRTDDLWVAAGGFIEMLPSTGKAPVPVQYGAGTVLDLSVAPDGVRVALIVRNGSQRQIELAAITQPVQESGTKPPSPAVPKLPLGTTLAPNISAPASLDWYTTDDLVALGGAGQKTLYEVPVDGQPATAETTPPGAASITADGMANVLVIGLVGGHLDISPTLEGPWEQLANPGQDPAYP
jgi:Lipoprotein LpqB beta-propeller domain/Sporulation and spore germination